MAIVDLFSRYIRAKALQDERAENTVRTLVEEGKSVSSPMEFFFSNGGPDLVGDVAEKLTEVLGAGRMQTSDFHPRANEIVESWTRTLIGDPACLTAAGGSDWEERIA